MQPASPPLSNSQELSSDSHDGGENGEVRDVAADDGREEAGAPEVLQLDGQEEGDEAEQDAHQEDVGLVVAALRLEPVDDGVVRQELKEKFDSNENSH